MGAPLLDDPITLSYGVDDGVTNAQKLRIAKQEDSCWIDIGGVGTADGIGTITSTVHFTTYGDFVLANAPGCFNPLPVKLINFVSDYRDEIVFLNWKTASEKDNQRFEVERTLDGKHWITIGIVAGNGNSNSIIEYGFEDRKLPTAPKVIYYRLRQVDYNGEFDYSPIVAQYFPGRNGFTKGFRVYPIPASNCLIVENTTSKKTESRIKIYDIHGKQWISDVFIDHKYFDLTNLSTGLYFITIYNSNGEVINNEKIIVNR